MTVLPVLASGSTAGKPILVEETASPGTTLHAATDATGTAGLDEIWVWVTNNHTEAVTLTLQFGGTAAKDQMEQSIPSKQGYFLLIPGWRLNTSAEIKAFASVANVVSCQLNVNRYSA